MRILFAILLLVGIGCVSTREAQRQGGRSETYIDGYEDGLKSGAAAAGNPFSKARKDVRRYEAEAEYQKGWEAGFDKSAGGV